MSRLPKSIMLAGCALLTGGATVVAAQLPDSTLTREFDEVVVTARAPDRILDRISGNINVSASLLSRQTRFMGVADPMRFFQTLPAVTTGNDIGGGMNVQGNDFSRNLNTLDGAEIVNPSHLLGLFSIFNTAHFKSYGLDASAHSAMLPDVIGAAFSASTEAFPDTVFRGEASAGVVMSSVSIALPLRAGRSSVSVSARRSMLDLLFPSLLKIDHALLDYALTDANLTYTQLIGRRSLLKINLFASRDRLNLSDNLYDTSGHFRWSNLMASASLTTPASTHILSWSDYTNRFDLYEANASLRLPSGLGHAAYRGSWMSPGHALEIGWGADGRFVAEQGRRPDNETTGGRIVTHHTQAVTLSAAAAYRRRWRRFGGEIALRLAWFCESSGFRRLYPQPRVSFDFSLPQNWILRATYGRHAQFTHLVKESGTGLPVDFWINASRRFRPARSAEVSLSASGSLFNSWLGVDIELYGKRFTDIVEFDGAVLNMVNGTYNPLDDLMSGRGKAYGASLTLMHNFGSVRGRLGYNIGRSKSRFDRLGNQWFPADHDRLHDLTAAVSWDIDSRWRLSASYAYATGNPYTSAAYGYMIGENLICEYNPHNSSRLPAYKRLDLSADWTIAARGRVLHELNMSFYNLLFNENVMFIYVTYSAKKGGLVTSKTGLKTVIPSITYTIKF